MPYENRSMATAVPCSVKNVLVCDTHPVTVAGVKSLLSGHRELSFADSASSLPEAMDVLRESPIDVVLVEKAFGWKALEEFLASFRQDGMITPAIVIWGSTITVAETMRFMHAGTRGVLLKTTDASSFVACLRAVAHGHIWMDDCMLRTRIVDHPRTTLTEREQQVYDLVQHGFTNKAVALELQIKPGTVKIHMKHIFEKTGIRGRHSLALANMFGDGKSHSAVA
jgi:two-component system, NarL family, nitrate/nitrite response regulator NarL